MILCCADTPSPHVGEVCVGESLQISPACSTQKEDIKQLTILSLLTFCEFNKPVKLLFLYLSPDLVWSLTKTHTFILSKLLFWKKKKYKMLKYTIHCDVVSVESQHYLFHYFMFISNFATFNFPGINWPISLSKQVIITIMWIQYSKNINIFYIIETNQYKLLEPKT